MSAAEMVAELDGLDWHAVAEQRPMDVVRGALAKRMLDQPLTDDQEDAAQVAGMLLAAGHMVRAGADIETVMSQFEDRPWQVSFSWERATDEIGIEVEWLDEDGAS